MSINFQLGKYIHHYITFGSRDPIFEKIGQRWRLQWHNVCS